MPRRDKTLTKRDLTYLALAAKGYTNKEVAEKMGVSSDVVVSNTYRRIMKTLGHRNLRQMWFELGKSAE